MALNEILLAIKVETWSGFQPTQPDAGRRSALRRVVVIMLLHNEMRLCASAVIISGYITRPSAAAAPKTQRVKVIKETREVA